MRRRFTGCLATRHTAMLSSAFSYNKYTTPKHGAIESGVVIYHAMMSTERPEARMDITEETSANDANCNVRTSYACTPLSFYLPRNRTLSSYLSSPPFTCTIAL